MYISHAVVVYYCLVCLECSSKWFRWGEGGRQSKIAANSKSHAVSHTAYVRANANFHAIWETGYVTFWRIRIQMCFYHVPHRRPNSVLRLALKCTVCDSVSTNNWIRTPNPILSFDTIWTVWQKNSILIILSGLFQVFKLVPYNWEHPNLV